MIKVVSLICLTLHLSTLERSSGIKVFEMMLSEGQIMKSINLQNAILKNNKHLMRKAFTTNTFFHRKDIFSFDQQCTL